MEAPFIDLINWRNSLHDPSRVSMFLSKWGLELPEDGRSRVASALQDLGALLAGEVTRVQAGEPLSPDVLARLDAAISAVTYRSRLSSSPDLSVKIEPERKDSAWVTAQIAESFVDFLLHGDPKRLKNCANPDCGWLFYDDSPALSRVWCDSRTCGNLMKVRRFRERAKKER